MAIFFDIAFEKTLDAEGISSPHGKRRQGRYDIPPWGYPGFIGRTGQGWQRLMVARYPAQE